MPLFQSLYFALVAIAIYIVAGLFLSRIYDIYTYNIVFLFVLCIISAQKLRILTNIVLAI